MTRDFAPPPPQQRRGRRARVDTAGVAWLLTAVTAFVGLLALPGSVRVAGWTWAAAGGFALVALAAQLSPVSRYQPYRGSQTPPGAAKPQVTSAKGGSWSRR